ncbi:DUF676-domain-containing protein [Schizopora paradoxa]|uniref:DUF676-domain-containing protein n=1 Tax=Schizopora paradoxa TaxID=27342 RepID=A0A0H2R1J1_9AGAM|nr:DUF676-domain-containing protein [Schizopora paradoxa]
MRNIHLLVLIHGMWGNPDHLAEMNRIIQETKGPASGTSGGGDRDKSEDAELEVLVAQSNRDEGTYDGIDWGGERVADEVYEKYKQLESNGDVVTRFSISGYSLGGLLSRYVIGALYQRKFFDKVEPINFATFATPHLGLLREDTFFSTLKAVLGPRILSRTGEQFYATDSWGSSGRPLVEVMADKNQIFYKALSLFKHKKIYGNAVNDLTVPYATALIATKDPFAYRNHTGLTVEFDPKYEPIIVEYSIPAKLPEKKPAPSMFSAAWFKTIKPSRFLPPPLQLKFPLNILTTALLPILFPTFIMLVIVRLSLHTRSSRKRIKLLEADESATERLVHAFAKIERQMEGAMVDLMDEAPGTDVDDRDESDGEAGPSRMEKTNGVTHSNSGDTLVNGNANGTSNGSAVADDDDASAKEPSPPTTKNYAGCTTVRRRRKSCTATSFTTNPAPTPPRSFLSASQANMAASLNALPGLTKHLVFIDPIRNSHATIVARDVKNFEFHKRGWGVLQHWADAFVL